MGNIYESLGIPTVINAKGTATRLGGGFMDPAVLAAMREATEHCVDMATLQGRASEIIAEVTGAEAGIVTAGASAGLLLGAAACIAGLNPGYMNRLPDTRKMPNRVVMSRGQRNFYDHAARAVGARVVDVGLPDRVIGVGVRDTEAWEVAEALDDRTACVLHVSQPSARPSLSELVEVAHAKGVPVLVDAAGQLPPVSNLRRFIEQGADLVSFSGGKAIRGPQASGILCGRRDLIASALLQNLDLDYHPEQWQPPASIFGNRSLPGLPQHGIGRSAKVGKEQIVALLVALKEFANGGADTLKARCRDLTKTIHDGLTGAAAAQARMVEHPRTGLTQLLLEMDAGGSLSAMDVVLRLQHGSPSIHAEAARVDEGIVIIDAGCLRVEDAPVVSARLSELLA